MTAVELTSLEQRALLFLLRAVEELVNGSHQLFPVIEQVGKAQELLIAAANAAWKEHTDASLR